MGNQKVARLAFNDMKESLEKKRIRERFNFGNYSRVYLSKNKIDTAIKIDVTENWVAGFSSVFTKESKRLNRLLGI